MIENNLPTILLIFGITGDLARRYLLPAINAIARVNKLPRKFKVVGITRQSDKLFYRMDTENLEDYLKLKRYLNGIEKNFPAKAQRLFYLSVPAPAVKSIVKFLGKSGLAKGGRTKLLLEKPFGSDLPSAKGLTRDIAKYFKESQIYRIDHYLAKEMAQNIVVFRNGNSLFKKTWNSDFIESINILGSEKIGIKDRAHFYEQTGALRDYAQGHLLQLAALVLMDLPDQYEWKNIRDLRLLALRKLRVARDKRGNLCVVRGQYAGYRRESGNPKSAVETFVSFRLESSDPKWSGVPITVSTGKALDKRLTEIRIRYKKTKEQEANELVLRLQPDPGIEFGVFTKRPGYEREILVHHLQFNFMEYYPDLPDAYEQVLWSALNSDHSLFASGAEILESWRIVDDIQKSWEKSAGPSIYKKGSSIHKLQRFLNR